jgi:hypothetical protein
MELQMMNDYLKILNDMATEALQRKHPSVPDYAIPRLKFNDKTANGLTKCIIDFIRLDGGHAERVNSTGKVIKQGRAYRWVYGTGTRGSSDIHAVKAGKSVMIEIKIGKDKQSQHQKDYQAKIEASGAIYWIVVDFEDFIAKWNHIV